MATEPIVLHVSSPLTWRGGEQQVAYLMGELHALGVRQALFCRKGGDLEAWARAQGFEVFSAPKRLGADPAFARNMHKAAQKIGANIIHCHDSGAHTAGYIATAMFGNKTPLVVSRRVDFKPGKSPMSGRKYDHKIVARILCVSNAIAEVARPVLKNPDVLKTVYSGIDLSRFQPGNRSGALRKELGIDAATFVVGTVGALVPHKDHSTFLKVAKTLLDGGLPAHFVIVGSGELEAGLKAECTALGLSDVVHFTGWRNDIPAILPDFDCFLFTSIAEGLGTSILDALASGLPVVATNAGGIPEIFAESNAGLLADAGDVEKLAKHVLSIATDETLAAHLSQGALERVKAFSKGETAKQTLSQYRSVLATG